MGFTPSYTAQTMDFFLQTLLTNLATPEWGLVILFVCAVLAATLLPMGSEPVLLALLSFHPDLLWTALAVATVGNTLGGMVSWWMGWGTHQAVDRFKQTSSDKQALKWLEKMGPKACFFSWLPIVGDPICAVAGWLRMPFWACTLYMAVGKFLRYLFMTGGLLWLFPPH